MEKKNSEKESLDAFRDWEDQPDELAIDWKGMVQKAFQHWKSIAVVTVLSACLGVAVALVQKKMYTVTVVVTPEYQSSSASRMSSTLSSLSSMLGMNMSGATSNDALNIRLFPEIATSIPFLTQLFDVEVTPDLSEEDWMTGAPQPQKVRFYDYLMEDASRGGGVGEFISSILGKKELQEPDTVNQARLSRKQYNAVKRLRKAVDVQLDSKTYMATINVTLDDPWIATQMADTISSRLQQFILNYRIRKGQNDLEYYTRMSEETYQKYLQAQDAYARSVDFDRNVMAQTLVNRRERLQEAMSLSQQVYSQMVLQKEQALATIQEARPVFAVLQPASYPDRPSSMSRKLVVLLFMFLGFALSFGWYAVGREKWASLRSAKSEKA